MRIIFISLLLVISFTLNAQEAKVDIIWGNEHKEPRNAIMTDLVGTDETGYFALREGTGTGMFSNEGKIFVERYNMNMKLVKSNKIKLKYKNKVLQYEDLKLIGDKLYLFTSYKNRKRKTKFLFAQSINKRTLRLRNDMQILAKVPARATFSNSSFDIGFSRDSSKVLFFGQLPYKSNQPERFHVKICDSNLDAIWEKNITLPHHDAQFNVEKYKVDNEGNVHVLGILFDNKTRRTKRNNKPTYKYVLLQYAPNGELQHETPIEIGDKFITDLTFEIQKNGNVVCAGFYSERNSNSVRGTYYFKVNKETGEIYNQELKTFDFDFLTELYSERGKRKAQKAEERKDKKRQAELYEYNLDKLILRSDGGAVLIAEQFYVREESQRYRDYDGFWQYRNYNHYYYNDIIVVNISPLGEIEWATHVPKQQITTDDGGYFSSYSFAVTPKAIYMVFNDNGKNFAKDKRKNKIYDFNGSRSVVALVKIRPNGTISKYPLFSNKEEGIITRPKVSKQTQSNELIIYGERSRKYKFARLKF